MPAITVHNLSPEAHRALKARAASHGRSTEGEARSILEAATAGEVRLGSLLVDIGTEARGDDLESERDRTGPDPVDLS